MKIFFHIADLDGRASGAILARKYPNAELFGYNYGYNYEEAFKHVQPNEAVIFADICPTLDALNYLLVITKDITVIDHHTTTVTTLERLSHKVKSICTDGGIGACTLVWKWCYPDHKVPKGIMAIAEYDDWFRTEYNKWFKFGCESFNTFPTSFIWGKILDEDPGFEEWVLEKGKVIVPYLVTLYKRIIRSYSVIGTVAGYTSILVNQGAVDGMIFDSVDGQYPIMVRAVLGKDMNWYVSIASHQSTDIDVSKIAEQYGGGGRFHIAGFSVSDLSTFFTPINLQP